MKRVGSSWSPLENVENQWFSMFCRALAALGGVLEASGKHLGASKTRLGASWSRLGGVLECLGGVSMHLGASWSLLED